MAGCVLGVVVTILQATLFVFQLGSQQVLEIGFVIVLSVVRVDFLTVDVHCHGLEQGVQLVVGRRRVHFDGQVGSIFCLVGYL